MMLIINIINKHFIMLRLFEKKYFFSDVKYLLLVQTKTQGVETEWQRLGDVGRDKERVSWASELILRIRRLQRSFSGAYGCSAPLPHMGRFRKNFVLILKVIEIAWECYRFLCSSFS